jgi:hypothetical protein
MTEDKRYRECMAEIIGVLKKWNMAGAVTVVDKERAMFKYHFPTWSVISLGEDHMRFRSKRVDFPSLRAQKEAAELSAHIIMQMRDVAANTFALMEDMAKKLRDKLGMEHTPFADFDPERNQ